MLLITEKSLARVERLCRAYLARERWLREADIADVRRARDFWRCPQLRELPAAVQAAVSIDGTPVGAGPATSGTTLDINVTVGNNANRGLAVFVHRDSNPEYSSFTLSYQSGGSGGAWNAVSGAATDGASGDGRDVTSYFSVAPSVGTYVVRVTFPSTLTSGDVNAFLFSLHGVDQTTPTSGGVNGFTSTSLTVASSSGGLALWCVQSNTALTFTGADTSPDVTGGMNLSAYGLSAAGTGGNLTVNFSASARGCAAFNVAAAAAASASLLPPRNQRGRYAHLLGF